MAEEVDNGRVRITKAELMTPIIVETFNTIQVPEFTRDSLARLFVSQHGDMSKTWFSLTQDTVFTLEPPFYVYAKLPCDIPALEAE